MWLMKKFFCSFIMAVISVNHFSVLVSSCEFHNCKDPKCYTFENKNYEEYFKEIKGCLVIYDENKDEYTIYNEELAKQEISPYETFDIISLYLGLKHGLIRDWEVVDENGEVLRGDSDHLKELLTDSLNETYTPFFKELVDRLGCEKIKMELEKLKFGNCNVSEWNGNYTGNLGSYHENGFWLGSCLKISAINWVEVLNKLKIGKDFNCLFEKFLYRKNINGYEIYGRLCHNSNCYKWDEEKFKIEEQWFLGMALKGDKKICFAANINVKKVFEVTDVYPHRFIEDLVYSVLIEKLL